MYKYTVSSNESSKIPLIILGNTPITSTYGEKVDHLKNSGIIQGVWSINPNPLNNEKTIKFTENKGFIRFDTPWEFKNTILNLLSNDLHYFSGMVSIKNLGHIIELANHKESYKEKGDIFLHLIRGDT